MPVKPVLRSFQEFAKLEASGGILLFVCALGALIWANSPWADGYHTLWQTQLRLSFGEYSITKPLLL